MNKHLKLVRVCNDTLSFPQAEHGANTPLSDMDIVLRQALLMEEGSRVFKAINAGEMVEILVGLVKLSYCALGAIAMRGGDVTDHPVSWQHDGFVISVVRILSDKINSCTSGNIDDYSAVYCLCDHLTRSFINADFDKAFAMIHDGNISKHDKEPDFSDCLYE